VPTVSLTPTIKGNGSVTVSGKPRVTCVRFCRRTLLVKAGSKVAVVPKPDPLWKLAPFGAPCNGTTVKCPLTMTGPQQVAVTFVPPGGRTNPIPLDTVWPTPGGWALGVSGAETDVSGRLTNPDGTAAAPRPGAEFVMFEISATYQGGGSQSLLSLQTEGVHNAAYVLGDGDGCGPGSLALPSPDLQPIIEDGRSVYSGQTVTGNVCFEVAADEADSLLFYVEGISATDAEQRVWFSLVSQSPAVRRPSGLR
jgi:hypothetical protein